jgi:hypothetical protein
MGENEKKLIQTKSFFTMSGIIIGKDNPKNENNGYKSGTTSNNKNYRGLKFLLKTNDNNLIPVEIFGTEKDFVYAFNKTSKQTQKIAWKDRTKELPKGFNFIYPEAYDLVETVMKNYKDGDSVYVNGEIQVSDYYNEEVGKNIVQKRFTIKNMGKLKNEINFEVEDFVEKNNFTQEIIIGEVEIDKELNKTFINSYVIVYPEKVLPLVLEINNLTHKNHSEYAKKFKLGDFIKVVGLINNRAKLVEIEDSVDLNVVGAYAKQRKEKAVKEYEKNLQILDFDIESFESKKYSEDDLFIKKEEIKKTSNKQLNLFDDEDDDRTSVLNK